MTLRMPALDTLVPTTLGRASRPWTLVFRGYLHVARGLVLVRIAMLDLK